MTSNENIIDAAASYGLTLDELIGKIATSSHVARARLANVDEDGLNGRDLAPAVEEIGVELKVLAGRDDDGLQVYLCLTPAGCLYECADYEITFTAAPSVRPS